jgi:uncharacterized protein YhfF
MTLEEALKRYPGAETFKFGDGPELSAWLLKLVRSGAKTATCGALQSFLDDGDALPVLGRRDIVLEWDGRPALVIETVEVSQCRFDAVEADFALAEGENDSLEGWRRDHRMFLERNGGWSPDMMLVCERFRMIEDFAEGETKEGPGA